eukprot:2078380-Rhodomonas_salina.6
MEALMSVLDEDEGGEVASALLCYPLAMRSLALVCFEGGWGRVSPVLGAVLGYDPLSRYALAMRCAVLTLGWGYQGKMTWSSSSDRGTSAMTGARAPTRVLCNDRSLHSAWFCSMNPESSDGRRKRGSCLRRGYSIHLSVLRARYAMSGVDNRYTATRSVGGPNTLGVQVCTSRRMLCRAPHPPVDVTSGRDLSHCNVRAKHCNVWAKSGTDAGIPAGRVGVNGREQKRLACGIRHRHPSQVREIECSV